MKHSVPAFPDKKQVSTSPSSFWETLDAVISLNDTQEAIQVSQKNATVVIHETIPIGIFWLGDAHLFSAATDHKLFKKDIERVVASEGAYVCGIGDLIDAGVKYRSLIDENRISIAEQTAALRTFLLMLDEMHKLIAVVSGNHELFVQDIGGSDPANTYMLGNKVPYFRSGGTITLELGLETYKLLIHHTGKNNSSFNPNHSNRRLLEAWGPDSDIVVSGHTHLKEVAQSTVSYGNRKVTFIKTGTYKIADEYGKRFGFPDAHRPGAFSVFYPERKKIISFDELEDGLAFLEIARLIAMPKSK